jgi:hypothetical protein
VTSDLIQLAVRCTGYKLSLAMRIREATSGDFHTALTKASRIAPPAVAPLSKYRGCRNIVYDMIFERLSGEQARATGAELAKLYAEVYAEPPYREGPAQVARFADQLAELWGSDGFTLARAIGPAGELVGVAYGRTMAAGSWFSASSPPPSELRQLATFAVMEWMVRKSWRRRGVGCRLLAMILAGRPERWSVLMSDPAAPARQIYSQLGWRRVGTSQPELFPEMEILALPLPLPKCVDGPPSGG